MGLIGTQIVSIAVQCSCGKEMFLRTTPGLYTSTDACRDFMRFVTGHRPLWLLGWNCYAFDNMHIYSITQLKRTGITNDELESIWRIVEVSCTTLLQPSRSRLVSIVINRSLNGFLYFTESRGELRHRRTGRAVYTPTPDHGSVQLTHTAGGRAGMNTFADAMLTGAIEMCTGTVDPVDPVDRFTSFLVSNPRLRQ
jgi:hypothetical protein